MKPQTYAVYGPMQGLCKQHAIWGTEGGVTSPLVYLQRPRWIEDDQCWNLIVSSIRMDLPKGVEIK